LWREAEQMSVQAVVNGNKAVVNGNKAVVNGNKAVVNGKKLGSKSEAFV